MANNLKKRLKIMMLMNKNFQNVNNVSSLKNLAGRHLILPITWADPESGSINGLNAMILKILIGFYLSQRVHNRHLTKQIKRSRKPL